MPVTPARPRQTSPGRSMQGLRMGMERQGRARGRQEGENILDIMQLPPPQVHTGLEQVVQLRAMLPPAGMPAYVRPAPMSLITALRPAARRVTQGLKGVPCACSRASSSNAQGAGTSPRAHGKARRSRTSGEHLHLRTALGNRCRREA